MLKLGSFCKFNRRLAILVVAISLVAGCSRGSISHSLAAQSAPSVRHPEKSSGRTPAPGHSVTKIKALGAENEYANVISQIGGKYVEVSAIMSDQIIVIWVTRSLNRSIGQTTTSSCISLRHQSISSADLPEDNADATRMLTSMTTRTAAAETSLVPSTQFVRVRVLPLRSN